MTMTLVPRTKREAEDAAIARARRLAQQAVNALMTERPPVGEPFRAITNIDPSDPPFIRFELDGVPVELHYATSRGVGTADGRCWADARLGVRVGAPTTRARLFDEPNTHWDAEPVVAAIRRAVEKIASVRRATRAVAGYDS